jgi:hypothetical protein
VLEGVADRWGEVDGIGVSGGVVRLRLGGRLKQEGEEESRNCFCPVFYRCSPELLNMFTRSISVSECGPKLLTQPPKRLDVRHRKLYPWAPAFAIDRPILAE